MRVLVTGSSSLIGRHVVARLVSRGDEVTVLQRQPARHSSGLILPGTATARPVGEVLGDIADPVVVARAIEGQDAVIHLAAKVGVVGAWSDYERINVGGTRVVLAAAERAGVNRFVHVSSPSVAHGGHPLVGVGAAPAAPDATRGHYSLSKARAELLALGANSSNFSVVAIRPHLVWGPGDSQLVGRIVERARTRRLALVGSGAVLVDTTVVDNAADALVVAVDRAPDLGGQALVVSNGEPRPIGELVARIVMAAGLTQPSLSVPTWLAKLGGQVLEWAWTASGRTEDPPMTVFLAEQLSTAHWFDQRRTREALGWSPMVSLDEGFRRLARHYARESV